MEKFNLCLLYDVFHNPENPSGSRIPKFPIPIPASQSLSLTVLKSRPNKLRLGNKSGLFQLYDKVLCLTAKFSPSFCHLTLAPGRLTRVRRVKGRFVKPFSSGNSLSLKNNSGSGSENMNHGHYTLIHGHMHN